MVVTHLRQPPIPSILYDTYWQFATRRQNIFFASVNHDPQFVILDPILRKFKFTNAYRASDRVSQYLIRHVIYNGIPFSAEDLLFRILLFKLFNRIETWEALEQELGPIAYRTFNYARYVQVLGSIFTRGLPIYSAAYIMPSAKSIYHHMRKYQNHLCLLDSIMRDKLSTKIAWIKSLAALYNTLLQYPSLGPFLAFQFSIDINYSELCDFSEMSFVVAGPGARSGIRKCFDSICNYSQDDVIRWMAERQENECRRLDLHFQNLWGRPLQLIDCQNLFCEMDKYCRIAYPSVPGIHKRTQIKQQYKKSTRGPIPYFYPQNGISIINFQKQCEKNYAKFLLVLYRKPLYCLALSY